MSTFARYLHTLRHLRPGQVHGRLWFRLYQPRPARQPAPPRRTPACAWPGPALRPPSLTGPDTLRLLGDERTIATAADWQDVHPDALWRYNLHYFADLDAPDAAPADGAAAARATWQRAFVARWLVENPPAVGVGWEPYPTSLRLVTWLRWLLRGHAPLPGMLHSLAIQARHLRRRLEHHLLGNHLFVNAKALVFAGTCFTGAEADGWRAEGERLVARELAEQVLADGGHFERSPMYHALIFEDVLDLIALGQVFPGVLTLGPALHAAATRMWAWLDALTHPDGEIALFNDAALGIAAPPAALAAYARSLGVAPPPAAGAVVDLAASGYTRIARGAAVLLADTGDLGPDYLPAHGHADTLGFELSYGGRRVVVDSGVSEYGAAPERVRQRGTAAHSTVVVDGADSSEVWGGFRVARRARVHDRRLDVTPAQVTLHASHDGYQRLPGRVTHARTWVVDDGGLTIDDEIRGAGHHRVELFFHLAPELTPTAAGAAAWILAPGLRVEVDPALGWRLCPGTVHPRMGARLPAWILAGACDTALPVRARTRFVWT